MAKFVYATVSELLRFLSASNENESRQTIDDIKYRHAMLNIVGGREGDAFRLTMVSQHHQVDTVLQASLCHLVHQGPYQAVHPCQIAQKLRP